ncbi:MAG: hypothetical protein R8G66_26785 [Cytophagales bacterium]|nr:hypothetical protein [Cytophagales bacterium]
MSYLNTPRLVFSGDFLSDVSTVNNDPAHYNNATFEPNFQEWGQGAANGWWNPEGGAVFDFQNCTIQKLTYADGSEAISAKESPLIGQLIQGAEGRTTGKMVDLDPQQQGVSALWAVHLRITTSDNELILDGELTTVSFRDLQMRQTNDAKTENGQALGGSWTTTLFNIQWGEKANDYRFFKELRNTTQGNKLSLNLNAFGYFYNRYQYDEKGKVTEELQPRYTLGFLLGAIGPWFEGEPETFAPARRLYGTHNKSATGFQTYFSNTNFQFDAAASSLTMDFGSSFPIVNATGKVNLNLKLLVAVTTQSLTNSVNASRVIIKKKDFASNYHAIGELDYTNGAEWLPQTGGIVEFKNIDAATAQVLASNQVVLLSELDNGNYALVARESIGGYNVRADNFVLRLDTDEQVSVNFYAYQWGNPLAAGTVDLNLQPPTPVTPKGPNSPISEVPGNNYPVDGLSFSASIEITNGSGILPITGNAIHNPRGYIDGQIYWIEYALRGVGEDPAIGPFNNEYITIHLYDYFKVPDEPIWSDIAEIMIQYGNLYPIMSKFIANLGDPEAVIARKELLHFAFGLELTDSMYMPVTRDLSAAKKETILKWLENPIIGTEGVAASPASGKKHVAKSPAPAGQEITEKQKNLKLAVLAKKAEIIVADAIENLKF